MNKLLLFLLFSSIAYAQDDQVILDGGVGVFHSAEHGLYESKTLSLGIQEDLWGPLKQRGIVGGWLDDGGEGRSGSAFIAGQLGFEVNSNGLVGSVFSGPCLISSTDTLLGGYFQFMDDLHLGIQDQDGNYIGILYRHFSSAGLEMPNEGRDFLGIELRW